MPKIKENELIIHNLKGNAKILAEYVTAMLSMNHDEFKNKLLIAVAELKKCYDPANSSYLKQAIFYYKNSRSRMLEIEQLESTIKNTQDLDTVAASILQFFEIKDTWESTSANMFLIRALMKNFLDCKPKDEEHLTDKVMKEFAHLFILELRWFINDKKQQLEIIEAKNSELQAIQEGNVKFLQESLLASRNVVKKEIREVHVFDKKNPSIKNIEDFFKKKYPNQEKAASLSQVEHMSLIKDNQALSNHAKALENFLSGKLKNTYIRPLNIKRLSSEESHVSQLNLQKT